MASIATPGEILVTPTRRQVEAWEARLDIGWPTDPDELLEWQTDGHEPEHTLETLEVPAPPREFLVRLDHHVAHTRRLIPAAPVLVPWKCGESAPALAVCVLAEALDHHDHDAAIWLHDVLWDLLEWSTWPERDRRQAWRTFERDLRAQDRQRAKALDRIEQAAAAFVATLRADWCTFEPEDYLDTLHEWRRDWLASC